MSGETSRVLIVDDDQEFLDMLRAQLELQDEFRLTTCGTGLDALRESKSTGYDLIVLDVGLPDIDGREVCRQMRRDGVSARIIMLAGAATDADMILGLDAGADDFIAKPVRLSVLLARMRAKIRQFKDMDDAEFAIGPYTFHPARKLLTGSDGGEDIRLTDKETAVLKFLCRAGDRVVSHDDLMVGVWGYNTEAASHTLETHVYRLRRKIEADPSNPKFLVTDSGGYRLIR